MSLFESFNSKFLISLGLTLLLISFLYFYITNKFAEQDHKLNSMFSLVSTMAEEQQYFRAKLSNNTPNVDRAQFASHMFQTHAIDENEDINKDDIMNEELISVSDNSSSAYDAEEESDTSSYYDHEDEDDDIQVNNIDILNLGLINPENINIKDEEHNDKNNLEIEMDNYNNDIDYVKTIHLEEPINIISEINDLNEINDITANSTKNDYKKMPLNKLRELVLEKGIVHDASKLKKNDILKILEDV